eukprot:1140695-Pelagomonas_calceolata.AAC.3
MPPPRTLLHSLQQKKVGVPAAETAPSAKKLHEWAVCCTLLLLPYKTGQGSCLFAGKREGMPCSGDGTFSKEAAHVGSAPPPLYKKLADTSDFLQAIGKACLAARTTTSAEKQHEWGLLHATGKAHPAAGAAPSAEKQHEWAVRQTLGGWKSFLPWRPI